MTFTHSSQIQVYAHRGQTSYKYSENSLEAIIETFEQNFGVEIDVRFHANHVSLSHDVVLNKNIVDLGKVAEFRMPMAINLKEDGLIQQIEEIIDFSSIKDCFIFDGSIPEMYKAARLKMPHALRLSEFERELPWKSDYIWLDSFESDWWISNENVKKVVSENKVVFVSPELHGRDFENAWRRIKDFSNELNSWIGICTDYPMQFRDFCAKKND